MYNPNKYNICHQFLHPFYRNSWSWSDTFFYVFTQFYSHAFLKSCYKFHAILHHSCIVSVFLECWCNCHKTICKNILQRIRNENAQDQEFKKNMLTKFHIASQYFSMQWNCAMCLAIEIPINLVKHLFHCFYDLFQCVVKDILCKLMRTRWVTSYHRKTFTHTLKMKKSQC